MTISGRDLKNGITMLQVALWSEYRDARLEHHDDLSYTTHVTCKRCAAAWQGDSLSQPERHATWCPLSWAPEIPDPNAVEQRSRAATDFLYEHGWKKIMEDRNLSERMFELLFMLREVVKED
jgi:hypothetical protein